MGRLRDLEENAVSAIKTILENPESKRQALPVPLDNEGIRVTFCGLAVTAGHIIGPSGNEIRKARPRNPGHDDNLRRILAVLFTKPDLVTFDILTAQRLAPLGATGAILEH